MWLVHMPNLELARSAYLADCETEGYSALNQLFNIITPCTVQSYTDFASDSVGSGFLEIN